MVVRSVGRWDPDGVPVGSAEDRELTLAFQRGHKGAYQAIYDRYEARVHSVCRRMLTNPDDAHEAAQETFLRIYQALGRFNGRYQLGAWIARIATNVCLDHLRAKSRRPEREASIELMDLGNPIVDDDGPEDLVIRNAEGRRVRKVLASLPPMHRAAIVLRDFEGFTYQEAAIALGISEPQLKALLHRARQGFKRSWISAGLAALLPTRFVNRLRGAEAVVKDPGPASQAVTATVQAAPACTSAIQQCGQYVADKLAPVITMALVATAATGAGPATPAASSPDNASSGSATSVQRALGLKPDAAPKARARNRAALRPDQDEGAEAAPVAPEREPQPEPAPEPSEEAPPAPPEPGSGGDGEITPPSSSPSPPTAAQPPAVGFDWGRVIPQRAPKSSYVTLDCGNLSLEQRLETVVDDDDSPVTYPALLQLRLKAADNPQFEVALSVAKNGQEIHYSGLGSISKEVWSGTSIDLELRGTYSTPSEYAARNADLPASGAVHAALRIDCAARSVVTQTVTFGR